VQAVNNEDQLQINPGSATGAYSTFSQAVQPSFVLMDLDGSKVGNSRNLKQLHLACKASCRCYQ
jgi:predicted phosphodiesterase